jgi:undecaprenyl-diphosphatase
MPRPNRHGSLSVPQAVALGTLHGPAELLPISSSAHTVLIPWLLGWDYRELDAHLRKAFEVALHGGAAAALLITSRDEAARVLRSARLRRVIVVSCVPAAIAGYALEGPIERRLGTPLTIAATLTAGGVGMACADRMPEERPSGDAGAVDAIYLGLAQALALVPGVSRGGATRAAARALRFTRPESSRLSRQISLPVIAGAALLKGIRLAPAGLPSDVRIPFALGAAASFVSTLGAALLLGRLERHGSLGPYALYRVAVAAVALRRLSGKRP